MRKIHAFLLLLGVCLFSLPMMALTYTDNDGVTWTYEYYSYYSGLKLTGIQGNSSTVVVPASLPYNSGTANVVYIAESTNLFRNNTIITSVTLPNTIQGIGYGAFHSASNLVSINIPSSVKSIGYNAFRNCSSLTAITIPESVVSLDSYMFYDCYALQSAVIKANVKNLPEYFFYYCSQLSQVELPASLQSIGNSAFYVCNALKEISLPASVTKIENSAFRSCTSLTSIEMPKNIQSIGDNAFYNCRLGEITFPATVSSIGSNVLTAFTIIHFQGNHPCPLSTGSTINESSLVFVPNDAVEAYRTTEVWSSFASRIFPERGLNLDLTVSAQSNKSALHVAIGETNLDKVDSLKISGTMNSYDMMIIRNKMSRLRYLDMTDVSIEANPYEYYQGYCSHKDSLIGKSFSDLRLVSVKLPRTLKYIQSAFQNCSNLSSVEFYENLEGIGADAFRGAGLREVYIPANVTYLGERAFAGKGNNNCWLYSDTYSFSEGNRSETSCQYGDGMLTSVRFASNSKLKTISKYAFAGNTNLRSVIFGQDSLQSIMAGAFSNCGVDTIILPSTVNWVGATAFRRCSNLKHVELSENIQTLTGGLFLECSSLNSVVFKNGHTQILPFAFAACTNLTTVNLPSSVSQIKDYAFMNCTNMDTIRIASSVETVGTQAFAGCPKVRAIYTYTVEPTSIDQLTFSCWSIANLFVPKTSYYNYYYDTQWSQFLKLVEFEEAYEYFYVNNDYELGCDVGTISGKPVAKINEGGSLIIGCDTENTQDVSNIILNANDNAGASIIANCNLNADTLIVKIVINPKKWYFFCFPYDVPRALITLSKGQGVWYTYDGNIRAINGSGGWQKVADSEKWLHKNKGYIFQSNSSAELVLTVVNPIFGCKEVGVLLETFGAKYDGDASWNFVGNPYPSYFDINALFASGFSSPITIWNKLNQTYETVRPGDDTDYSFAPFEGFFVQKPNEETSEITFSLDGRESKNQSEERNAQQAQVRKAINPNRSLINLVLSNGKNADRTRIVFNDKAKVDYEIGIDAAKFLSTEAVPQLYSLENGASFAINERPVGDATIALGFVAPEDGQYTLSAPRMDAPVIIYDNVMKTEVDLAEGDYSFYSQAGTDNTRFAVRRAPQATTDIEEMTEALPAIFDIYSVNGVLLIEDATSINNLPAGAYILKANDQVLKFIIQ